MRDDNFQTATDVVQRQTMLYGNSITQKKVQKTKPKKQIQVRVASTDDPNSQEPRTSATNKTASSRNRSINKVPGTTLPTPSGPVVRSNKSSRVEVQKQRRENSSTTPNGYTMRRDKCKVPVRQPKKQATPKIQSNPVEKIRSHQTPPTTTRTKPITNQTDIIPSQQSAYQHQRRIEKSQRASSEQNSRNPPSSRQPLSRRSGLESSKSLSKSSIESSKSSSSGSRSRRSRLEFDGTIKTMAPTDTGRKPRERQFDSISKGEQQRWVVGSTAYNKSSPNTNGDVDNTRRSSNLSQNPFTSIQPSPSIIRNQQGNANTNIPANINNAESNIEVGKAKAINLYTQDGVERAIDVSNGNVQSSHCTTRRRVVWGAICCIIVAAAAVPCVLLLVDFSGNSFPKLLGARGVVASISNDICNESVPKSGDCTPLDSSDEQQGGELCNLVAKSMINTTIYGDIALINAGMCKKSLLAPELTVRSIKKAIDAESLIVVSISGADLVDVLNGALTTSFGASADPEAYPYAAGLRYNVEANLPPSERLSTVEVNRGLRDDEWKPIDIRRFYKVVTTASLASGGMGYASFSNVIEEWKDPLNIKTGDAFYNYATKHSDNVNWSELSSTEYSTQYFIGESEEPTIAKVPSRICHAMIPGQPESSFCTAADVFHGGEVCNLLSWMIYDQNFGINMVVLKGESCSADIEEGKFVESSFGIVLSENKSLMKADMLGSDIVMMINDGVSSAVSNGAKGNYPYAAGLKFDVTTMSSPMVSNVRFLTSGGNWVPIVDTDTYTVATTTDLLANTATTQDMGTTMKEQITSYAEDWNVFYKSPTDKASTQSYA